MEKTAYTAKEKAILATIIKEKGSVIECKKTDAANLEKKNKAWEEICTYYNAQPEVGCKRTAKQLKKCWANLKQAKRRMITEEKYQRLKTGGGSITDITKDPVMDLIDDAAPHLDVQLECQYDSSARLENVDNGSLSDKCIFENESTSCSSTFNVQRKETAIEPPIKKRCRQEDEETGLRLQKLKEAIEQQQEFHQFRMKAAQMELELLTKNMNELHNVKMETAKAELTAALKALEN